MSWECPVCFMLWEERDTCGSCGYERSFMDESLPESTPSIAISCADCHSERIGRLDWLPDKSASKVSYQAIGTRKAFAGAPPSDPTKPDVYWSRSKSLKRFRAKVGTMEAIVCTDCGRLERYVQDPHWTPIHELDGFTQVKPRDRTKQPDAKPMGRSLMKTGVCAKCHGLEVGHLPSLPDTGKSETKTYRRTAGVLRDGSRVGELEAYVCTKCGYLETFVKRPTKVPFEEIVGFSWVNDKRPTGPYR